jgi:hypothetical protein
MDDSGNFIVVWLAGSVWARVYDQNGIPVPNADNPYGEDFMALEGDDNPSVAALPGGGFLAVCDAPCSTPCADPDQRIIMAKRFDSTGMALEGFIILNDIYTWNLQPRVSANGNGYVAVWQYKLQESDSWDIRMRSVPISGPVGSLQRINTYLTDDQTTPVVSIETDGTVVAAWESDGQDGSGLGVFARDLDQSSEHQVNRTNYSWQYDAEVTHLINGKYVIVWSDIAMNDGDILGAIWIPEGS